MKKKRIKKYRKKKEKKQNWFLWPILVCYSQFISYAEFFFFYSPVNKTILYSLCLLFSHSLNKKKSVWNRFWFYYAYFGLIFHFVFNTLNAENNKVTNVDYSLLMVGSWFFLCRIRSIIRFFFFFLIFNIFLSLFHILHFFDSFSLHNLVGVVLQSIHEQHEASYEKLCAWN